MRRTRLCSTSCAPWRRAAATSARVRSPTATNPCASISSPPVASSARSAAPRPARRRRRAARAARRASRARPRSSRASRMSAVGERHVDRAGAPVRDGDAALRRHARDELVEQVQAADGEVEQRALFARLDDTAPACPADACVAPMPTGRSSTISTAAPRRASSYATAQPTMPAPTTMMSERDGPWVRNSASAGPRR